MKKNKSHVKMNLVAKLTYEKDSHEKKKLYVKKMLKIN